MGFIAAFLKTEGSMGKTILEMIDIKKSFSGIYHCQGSIFPWKWARFMRFWEKMERVNQRLSKILGGIYKPDSGTIKINGQEVEINGVSDAQEKGIGIIHQEIVLVPYLTVAQNLFLGREIKTKFGTVDMRGDEPPGRRDAGKPRGQYPPGYAGRIFDDRPAADG